MKRYFARLAKPLLAITVLALCLTAFSPALAADDVYTVQVTGTYGQTAARAMLDLVNDFRTGDEAFYVAQNNIDQVDCPNLQPLVYDYGLERVAMQRAIEVAMHFDHTRPNGGDCFEAYSLSGGSYGRKGENIAAGNGATEDTFNQWKEDGKPYDGQGHRRNMLNAGFNAIGIGHVRFNGTDYWVQEFGFTSSPNTSATAANESATTMAVQVSTSLVTQVQASATALTLEYGDAVDLPAGEAMISLTESWPGYRPFSVGVECEWTSDDETTVAIEADKLKALKVGSTTLSASVLGQDVELPVEVTAKDIAEAVVTLDEESYSPIYDGEPKQPKVKSVVIGEQTLTPETDYTVTYGENIHPDKGQVIVTGQGNYTGSVTAEFVIASNEPTSVTLDVESPAKMDITDTLQLTATLQPQGSYSELSWDSSVPGVATVDESGLVTPHALGDTIITVTTENDLSAQLTLTVADLYTPTAVKLDKSGTVELQLGATLQLNATLEPETAHEDRITEWKWTSEDDTIAEVSEGGLVTATGDGTTTITVQAIGDMENSPLEAQVSVHVTDPAKPTSISLEPAGPVKLDISGTQQLSAKVQPEGAKCELKWSASPEGIVNVSGEGLVSPLKEGEATVTVSAIYKEETVCSAEVTIKVFDSTIPTAILLTPSEETRLDISKTLQLTATLEPATAVSELSWTSDAPAIADVDQNGLVTPAKEGKATITVEAAKKGHEGETIKASVTIEVFDPTIPTAIVLTPSEETRLDISKTLQLTATLEPATATSELSWTSDAPAIADVDQTGLVTPAKEGKATITVEAAKKGHEGETIKASVTIEIFDPTILTALSLKETGTQTLDLRSTLELHPVFEPEGAHSEVEWASADKKIATVEGGIVTPVAEGTTTITATAVKKDPNGKTLSASVKVNVVDLSKPTGVHFEEEGPQTVDKGGSLQLHAVLEPEGALSDLTWKSSDKTIATVKDGVVTGVKEGTVTITVTTTKTNASTGKKMSATKKVTVVDPKRPTAIAIDQTGPVQLEIKNTAGIQLTTTMTPSTAESKLTWKSSDPKIAKVNAQGLVTPVKEGTVTITVTTTKTNISTKKAMSAKVKVKVYDETRPTGISLNETGTIQRQIDEPLVLTATMVPETAVSKLTWKSSNTAVAKVNAETGEVTLEGAGTATITVTTKKKNAAGQQLTASVKVKVTDPYRPTSVRFEEVGPQTVNKGETLQLHAAFEPESSNSSLTWKSSDKTIATVKDGVVTGVKEGTVTITVTTTKTNASTGKKMSATKKVTVVDPKRPTAIAIDQTGPVQLEIKNTAGIQLTTTMTPSTAESKLTWKSSDPKIAKVNAQGLVTPVKEGTVTITVTTTKTNISTKKAMSAKVKVKVYDETRPTGISLNETGTIQRQIDEPLELKATMVPETAVSKLTWKSSNTAVAKVNAETGEVTLEGAGTATITVTTKKKNAAGQQLTASVKVKVTDPYRPTSVKLDIPEELKPAHPELENKKPLKLYMEDKIQLVPVFQPEGANSKLTWKSSDKKIVDVDENGMLTAKKVGTATITVTTTKTNKSTGKVMTATMKVKVLDPTRPTSIAFETEDPVTVYIGGEGVQLRAKVEPAKAGDGLSWSSSNDEIARVDANGLVTGLQEGTVTITVKTKNTNASTGKKMSASITVIVKAYPSSPDPDKDQPTKEPDPIDSPSPSQTPSPSDHEDPAEETPLPTPDPTQPPSGSDEDVVHGDLPNNPADFGVETMDESTATPAP